MSVYEAFMKSVKDAPHVDSKGVDAGSVAAAGALARKIDAWDVIVQWAAEDAAESEGRPKVPQNDNVSISAFLKYCESLGLTPGARGELVAKKEKAPVNPIDELKQKRRRKAAGQD